MKVSQGYYKVYKFGGFAVILRQYANSAQKQLISAGNSEKYTQKKHLFAIFSLHLESYLGY